MNTSQHTDYEVTQLELVKERNGVAARRQPKRAATTSENTHTTEDIERTLFDILGTKHIA